jgi:hypothetical protein
MLSAELPQRGVEVADVDHVPVRIADLDAVPTRYGARARI